MKGESETGKERWSVLFKTIRGAFPHGDIRVIDKGRADRYWKIGIGMTKGQLDRELFIKVRHKVITHPEADYENRFLGAMKEAERILDSPSSSVQFLGTLFVDVEGITYYAGENLNDDWW
ncbi:MAG: hypothetical protein JRI72_12510 [Deltaproteobacteria bacterium]|nr:hypothetical protein [Deltaproteobacteria bacterium]